MTAGPHTHGLIPADTKTGPIVWSGGELAFSFTIPLQGGMEIRTRLTAQGGTLQGEKRRSPGCPASAPNIASANSLALSVNGSAAEARVVGRSGLLNRGGRWQNVSSQMTTIKP